MRKTGIVIPCYNEAKRLDSIAFVAAVDKEPELSFLFVNDGSTDNTGQILKSIMEDRPEQIAILTLDQNIGKAEAVRNGMIRLIEDGYKNVGYWDADLATPLEVIGHFCELLNTSDISLVMGSRVKLLGRHIERNPLRHYVGRVFATCASLLLKIGVYDTQCGAKIFKNTALLQQVFKKPFKVNWTFDVEMLARFGVASGLSSAQVSSQWYEYPLNKWVDVKGSKVNLKDYFIGLVEFCILFTCLYTPSRKRYKNYLRGSD